MMALKVRQLLVRAKGWVSARPLFVLGICATTALSTDVALARKWTIAKNSGSITQFAFLKISDKKAIGGQCVAPLKQNPKTILAKAGIRTVNAKPAEIAALAKGVQQIQHLGGGSWSPIKGARFIFKNSSVKKGGVAYGEHVGDIRILRSGSKPDDNVAHLIHELGHHVGHQQDLYARYKKFVGKSCQFSGYCRHVGKRGKPRNEEFAEVFAAFVLHPELLQKSGPNCQRAYDFFAKKDVFRHGSQAKCNAKGGEDDSMVASADRSQSRRVQSTGASRSNKSKNSKKKTYVLYDADNGGDQMHLYSGPRTLYNPSFGSLTVPMSYQGPAPRNPQEPYRSEWSNGTLQ